MNLYIETENGQIKNHPAFEENLIAAFGSVPEHWVLFVRVEPPKLGPYEKNQTVTYELVDGVYTDVFHTEQMTAEEITAKQDEVKSSWAQRGYPSWTFNETTCQFEPPTPRPTDDKRYRWDEATTAWIEVQI
jgi:hypothetical protein